MKGHTLYISETEDQKLFKFCTLFGFTLLLYTIILLYTKSVSTQH
jgi:hypothetical protein